MALTFFIKLPTILFLLPGVSNLERTSLEELLDELCLLPVSRISDLLCLLEKTSSESASLISVAVVSVLSFSSTTDRLEFVRKEATLADRGSSSFWMFGCVLLTGSFRLDNFELDLDLEKKIDVSEKSVAMAMIGPCMQAACRAVCCWFRLT